MSTFAATTFAVMAFAVMDALENVGVIRARPRRR